MKASAIRVAIGMVIFSIGCFAWNLGTGLIMMSVYYVGALVGIISMLFEE